jgi:hypothetical protein
MGQKMMTYGYLWGFTKKNVDENHGIIQEPLDITSQPSGYLGF